MNRYANGSPKQDDGRREISLRTRWLDAKGREWAIVEKLPFGRNVCSTTDRRYQMDWTTKQIRAATSAPDAEAALIEWVQS